MLNVVCFLSVGVCGWIVILCSGCEAVEMNRQQRLFYTPV